MTACALLRAFDATDDQNDIWIADEHTDMRHDDIDPAFKMTPTTQCPMVFRGSGLDQHDGHRFGVDGLRLAPSDELLAAAGLAQGEPWEMLWKSKASKGDALRYDAWSSQAQ